MNPDWKRSYIQLTAALVAGFALLGGLPLAGSAGESRTTHRVGNDRFSILFETLTDEEQAQLQVRSIESGLGGGFSLDLRESPLFQVILLDAQHPNEPPVLLEAPRVGSSRKVPRRFLEIRQASPGEFEIDIGRLSVPVSGSRQWVSVTLRVRMRAEDGAAEWSATASVGGNGSYRIVGFRYPYLRSRSIGPSGVDDCLVFPLVGGMLLEDPVRSQPEAEEFRDAFGTFSRYAYPGYTECQFFALYDNRRDFDTTTGGIYVAAEDTAGFHKSLFTSPSPDGKALDLVVGHFNFASDPYPEGKPSWDEFREISLGEKLPYRVVTNVFQGDWMTAADLYRAWLDRTKPPFLSEGPFRDRKDLSPETREILYGIAYRFSGGTAPIATEKLQANPDLAAVRKTLAFFTDGKGHRLPATLTLLGDLTSEDVLGNANDNGVWPPRSGLREWIVALRASEEGRAVVSIDMNRDMGNWSSNRSENPAAVRAMGLIRRPGGEPLVRRPSTQEDPGLHSVTCNGSQFIAEMRQKQFRRAFARFLDDEGRCMVDNVALSGRGSQSFLCYAPLFAARSLGSHHHTIGGGNFSCTGYRNTVRTLRANAGDRVRAIYPGGERSHEQLIDTSMLTGRFQVEPWDDTFHAGSTWIEGGIPIPLLSYLFHDFALVSARLPRRTNVASDYAEARFGEVTGKNLQKVLEDPSSLALERQRFAAATLDGRRISFYLEGRIGGTEDRFDRRIEAPPGEVDDGLDANYRFLREMIRLRGRAAPYLAFGRMLRPPVLEAKGSLVRVELLVRGRLEPVVLPGVAVSAWRSLDGDVAVILANYSGRAANLTLRFDPRAWGLPTGKPLLLVALDGTAHATKTESGGAVEVEGLRLGPDAPTAVLAVRPAPER